MLDDGNVLVCIAYFVFKSVVNIHNDKVIYVNLKGKPIIIIIIITHKCHYNNPDDWVISVWVLVLKMYNEKKVLQCLHIF